MLLLAIRRALPPRAIMALFALVVAGDMLWIDRTLIDGRPRDAWLDPYQELAEFLEADGAVRVYSPSYSLPQQAAAHWSIAQFGGVDPFQLAAYVDAFEAATGVAAQGYSVTLPAYDLADGPGANEDSDSEAAVLARANRDAPLDAELLGGWLVTHVVAAFPIEAEGLVLAAQIGDATIYRNTFAPDVTLAWDGPNRVTVRAAAPVDGTLNAVANGRWQDSGGESPGLPGPVDAPARDWTYRYDPSEVWIGLAAGGDCAPPHWRAGGWCAMPERAAISAREWRWALLFAAAVMIVTTIPYLAGWIAQTTTGSSADRCSARTTVTVTWRRCAWRARRLAVHRPLYV